ncbi:hypothetical protein BC829DRAFT_53985 [Chytridium lagenaria]|nr:hypothetical protein BC829DRAFT_53985 [Chytridium lagenaria]
MDSILKALVGTITDAVITSEDYGFDPIYSVHSRDYVEYFRNAYNAWVEKGGNPQGVFPDVYAVRDFSNERGGVETTDGMEFRADGGALGRPGYYCFDNTGIIAEGTFLAAYDAVQVALTATNKLMETGDQAVFALTRPPGHHAHEDLCGGYCFFNNAAIAVRYLIDIHKLEELLF